jgi:CRP-like cAMP-binding protein
MAKHDTSDNAQSTYHYLHLSSEELAQLPPDQLLQACLESRSLLQIVMGILLSPDASPTERIVACDLIYTQAMRMANEPTSVESEDVVADVKTVSERLGLRPSAVSAAYEALAERGAVRIDERVLPKQRHQLSLPLDQGTSKDARKK